MPTTCVNVCVDALCIGQTLTSHAAALLPMCLRCSSAVSGKANDSAARPARAEWTSSPSRPADAESTSSSGTVPTTNHWLQFTDSYWRHKFAGTVSRRELNTSLGNSDIGAIAVTGKLLRAK